MGAKDTMKTFFMSMNEQVAPTRGYGPKTVPTPMGPFSWDDNLQVWVNQNNGMQMNNISFQDMYLFDYDTVEGGGDMVELPNYYFPTPTLTPSSWGSFTNFVGAGSVAKYYASSSGGTTVIPNATGVTFSGLKGPISVTLSLSSTTGNTPAIYYVLDGGLTGITYTGSISINNSNQLKVGLRPYNGTDTGSGRLDVTDISHGNLLLQGLPYSYAGI